MTNYRTLATLLATVIVAGCARQIEGRYVGNDGTTAFTLMNGKYYGTSVAANEAKPARRRGGEATPIPLPYKVDGARLIVNKQGSEMVLEIMPDASLRAPGMMLRYARR